MLAIIIADNPFSGSAPACAALPIISISKLIYVGLELVIVLGGPSPSNIIALEPSNLEKSKFLAPCNANSSSLVNIKTKFLNS